MAKKNERRMCWNCHGSVSFVLSQCPYCGVELGAPQAEAEEDKGVPVDSFAAPFKRKTMEEEALTPPYGSASEYAVTDEEWNEALGAPKNHSETVPAQKNEMTALLLLLPGVVFFLFGLTLLLFSDRGVLTLQWNASFAYFYFIGAVPLLLLGWKSLR